MLFCFTRKLSHLAFCKASNSVYSLITTMRVKKCKTLIEKLNGKILTAVSFLLTF